MNGEKVLKVLHYTVIVIGGICSVVEGFTKVKMTKCEIRKEVDKAMEGQETSYTYEKFEKKARK